MSFKEIPTKVKDVGRLNPLPDHNPAHVVHGIVLGAQ